MTNAGGTTGCNPPGRGFESRRVKCGPVAQRIEQDARATGQDVSPNLVVMTEQWEQNLSRGECRLELQHHSGDDLRGSTPRFADALWHGRDSPSFTTLVAAAASSPDECERNYRSRVRFPPGQRQTRSSADRAYVSLTPRRRGHTTGECLRDYTGERRFESVLLLGGVLFPP